MALNDFLLELMNDPDKLAAFQNDPGSALENTDLSPVEREAVLSGDSERIVALLPAGQRIPPKPLMVSGTKVPYPRPDTPPKPTQPRPTRPRPTLPQPRSTPKPTKKP